MMLAIQDKVSPFQLENISGKPTLFVLMTNMGKLKQELNSEF